ncbi:hypothetical protein AMTRI_Chr13g122250 [Amborella trichopoda]
MSVAKMRMLRWMSGKTRRDRIPNKSIRENLSMTPIGDKMRESRLRWVDHVWRRPSTTLVMRCGLVQVEGLKRVRGRPKRTRLEVVRKDMGIYVLSEDMAFNRVEWRTRIHVAGPN